MDNFKLSSLIFETDFFVNENKFNFKNEIDNAVKVNIDWKVAVNDIF